MRLCGYSNVGIGASDGAVRVGARVGRPPASRSRAAILGTQRWSAQDNRWNQALQSDASDVGLDTLEVAIRTLSVRRMETWAAEGLGASWLEFLP